MFNHVIGCASKVSICWLVMPKSSLKPSGQAELKAVVEHICFSQTTHQARERQEAREDGRGDGYAMQGHILGSNEECLVDPDVVEVVDRHIVSKLV